LRSNQFESSHQAFVGSQSKGAICICIVDCGETKRPTTFKSLLQSARSLVVVVAVGEYDDDDDDDDDDVATDQNIKFAYFPTSSTATIWKAEAPSIDRRSLAF
jgi:hypothetical protein